MNTPSYSETQQDGEGEEAVRGCPHKAGSAVRVKRRCPTGRADRAFCTVVVGTAATWDADAGVLAFYTKNGFAPNAELTGKKRKTISMRLDLYR